MSLWERLTAAADTLARPDTLPIALVLLVLVALVLLARRRG